MQDSPESFHLLLALLPWHWTLLCYICHSVLPSGIRDPQIVTLQSKRIDLSILIKIQSDWHAPLFQTTIHLLHELARGLRKVCKHLRLPELRMQYILYITSMISRLYVLYVLYFIARFVLIITLLVFQPISMFSPT